MWILNRVKQEWQSMKKLVKRKKPKKVLIIKEKTMSEFDLVSAIVAAINADIASGNTNFSVALSPDSTQVVLTSSVSNPQVKTETFAVTNPTQAA